MNLRKKIFLLTLSSMLIGCTCSTSLLVPASADTNSSEINLKDSGQKAQFTGSEAEAMADYEVPYGFDTYKLGVNYGDMKEVSYYSKTTGNTRNCYVLLPPNYSADKKYPVLYLLHGIGGTDAEWLGGNPKEILGNLAKDGQVEDMIVVMPNIRAAYDDSVPENIFSVENTNAFDNFINDLNNDLMPFINANYSTKEGRENTAVAGLSMGGRESLYIGFKQPEKFGYIGAFSPAPGLLPDSTMNFPGQFTKEQFTIPQNSEYTPKFVMICVGNDDVVIGQNAKLYHDTLTENKVDHTYYTIDGNHDFTVWKHGLYNFAKRIFK